MIFWMHILIRWFVVNLLGWVLVLSIVSDLYRLKCEYWSVPDGAKYGRGSWAINGFRFRSV